MFIETIKFNEVFGSQGNVFLAELVKGDKGKMKPDHPISGKVQDCFNRQFLRKYRPTRNNPENPNDSF